MEVEWKIRLTVFFPGCSSCCWTKSKHKCYRKKKRDRARLEMDQNGRQLRPAQVGDLHNFSLTDRRSQQCVSGRISHPCHTVVHCEMDISCRLKEIGLRAGEVRGPAALLIWCQRVTQTYFPLVNITNMSRCCIVSLTFAIKILCSAAGGTGLPSAQLSTTSDPTSSTSVPWSEPEKKSY